MATTRKSAHAASVRRYRERMRAQGLRQVSLWLYDRSDPLFRRECRRQSLIAARAKSSGDIDSVLDQALAEIDDWTA
ncbi:MAG: DUF3018 family protein [Proteobacteria bacterium]|nr:DUF3018 family protein [Pseudomonadota bacterium]